MMIFWVIKHSCDLIHVLLFSSTLKLVIIILYCECAILSFFYSLFRTSVAFYFSVKFIIFMIHCRLAINDHLSDLYLA